MMPPSPTCTCNALLLSEYHVSAPRTFCAASCMLRAYTILQIYTAERLGFRCMTLLSSPT